MEFDRPGLRLSREAEPLILGYPWPGNIRELENVLKRAVILLPPGKLVLDEDSFSFLANHTMAPFRPPSAAHEQSIGLTNPEAVVSQLVDLVEQKLLSFPDIEDRVIEELFRRYQGIFRPSFGLPPFHVTVCTAGNTGCTPPLRAGQKARDR